MKQCMDADNLHRRLKKIIGQVHAFCEDLCAGYARVISGDKNVLFKLKALWIYLGMSFTNPQKYLKKIKKANRLAEYEEAVDALFREQELIL